MKKTRFTEEQIIRILRDADTKTIEAAAWQPGVSEQSIYRWKRQFGQMDVAEVRELRHLRQENARLKKVLAERDLEVEVMKELQAQKWSAQGHAEMRPEPPVRVGVSHRRTAWLCMTPRSGIRSEAKGPRRDVRLAQALLGVAKRYPQWGYRLAGGFLRHRGWRVNGKRVYRVWCQCSLQVPRRKPRKKVVTGATLQPTATQKNDVWSWDFGHDATTRGAAFRCLTVKDEATCFWLAIEGERNDPSRISRCWPF